jgi:3-oxoacyl-[acyl-carrier-protein] synthase-3
LSIPKRRVVRTLTGVELMAVGGYAPDNLVTNEQLASLGFDDDWILKRTGIQSRHRASPDQATSDICIAASRRCLARAGVPASELDLIIVGTMTPDQPTPSTACVVQEKLGSNAAAFDMNAACAGFVYALSTGMQFIKTGTYERVLVVGADLMGRAANPADRKTFPLFGDGGGAVLLGPGGEDQGFLSFTLGADGRGGELLCQPAGGSREPLTPAGIDAGRQYLQMDGRAVFKWAVRLIGETARDVIRHAELDPEDLDWVVFHQANQRILDAAVDDLGIDPQCVLSNVQRYGNTSAGSIPLVLHEADQRGQIKRGDRILLSGFGAGLAWGAAVLQW